MMDLQMNFRVAPEIYNITDAFDYSYNANLVLQLLASESAGPGFANPLAMYQGYYSATVGNTNFLGLTTEQFNAIGTWTTAQINL
jgi:hypothetical protein